MCLNILSLGHGEAPLAALHKVLRWTMQTEFKCFRSSINIILIYLGVTLCVQHNLYTLTSYYSLIADPDTLLTILYIFCS